MAKIKNTIPCLIDTLGDKNKSHGLSNNTLPIYNINNLNNFSSIVQTSNTNVATVISIASMIK